MQIACVDVQYEGTNATVACVVIPTWEADRPRLEFTVTVTDVLPYESGSFYRRELPCIKTGLNRLPVRPEFVVIDGYVWLGDGKPGLGAHLYDTLDRQVAVVGVAKTRFRGADPVIEVMRGGSQRPLYVSAAGLDLAQAADFIRSMHGEHRIPTILHRVDRLSRAG